MQKADIDKLATLARLDMTDSEKEGLLADFGSILTYIDQINSVSVSTSGGDALHQMLCVQISSCLPTLQLSKLLLRICLRARTDS